MATMAVAANALSLFARTNARRKRQRAARCQIQVPQFERLADSDYSGKLLFEGSAMARDIDDDAPHPLDIALGSRVRLRRKELGLSQSELANACGITFQQVQKYEHGTNRISFSRLAEIANALDCSIADLIDGLESAKFANKLFRQTSYLVASGASDLLDAFRNIGSLTGRRAVLSLARQLARDDMDGGIQGSHIGLRVLSRKRSR